MPKMPEQKPGRSKQDYGTPTEFLRAVRKLLGIVEFDYDLAASPENAVCPQYYTEEDNALVQPWKLQRSPEHESGWNWCNPPFGSIYPWVEKAGLEAWNERAQIAMLVPAGVGTDWWADHVHNVAYVHFLHGRLTFVGAKDPYPKDCALLLYSRHMRGGYHVWDWRKE